jgi:hypothetical protein
MLRKIIGPMRDKVMGLEETPSQGAFCYALLTNYYLGDQINMNEMGGAYGTYGRQDSCIQGFGRWT